MAVFQPAAPPVTDGSDNGAAVGTPSYQLLQGDAEEALRTLPAGSAHCAVTSPPYWNQREYAGGSTLGNERTVEEYVEHLVRIFRQLKHVLRSDGSLWLNIGDTYLAKNLVGVPWRVAIALQSDGWILRNAVVWDKVKGNPCNAKDKLRNVYEHVFHFIQSPTCYYDIDAIRNRPGKPYYRDGMIVTPTGVSGIRYRRQITRSNELTPDEKRNALLALDEALRKVEGGEMPDFRMIIRGTQRSTHSDSPEFSGRANELRSRGYCILPYHKNGTKPGDVWQVIPEDEWRLDGHFAVFPLELCYLPIRATCPPGGTVLDPFVGTGTALLAALELGRRGIGIDTSAQYLAIARRRIDEFLASRQRETLQPRLLP